VLDLLVVVLVLVGAGILWLFIEAMDKI